MKNTLSFPALSFMRLTDHEWRELRRMAADANACGRWPLGYALTNTLRSDVMTLAQYDALMAAYRHWLNWGFKDASV